MRRTTAAALLAVLIGLIAGCVTRLPPPADWEHEPHSDNQRPLPSWKIYKDENLLTGQHVLTVRGTSDADETKSSRFCFRRSLIQLVIYVVPSHEKVATARMGAGLLTLVRVDENRPVSPRSALGKPWGRGFNPRFPDASFPVDGTNPRSGIVEQGGMLDQLLSGSTLSARVPLEPATGTASIRFILTALRHSSVGFGNTTKNELLCVHAASGRRVRPHWH